MQEPQERMRFQNVSMQFPTDGGMLDVVSDMSFSINQGDFIALLRGQFLGPGRAQAGGIGLHPWAGVAPSEQAPQRLAGQPGGQVPQREVGAGHGLRHGAGLAALYAQHMQPAAQGIECLARMFPVPLQ